MWRFAHVIRGRIEAALRGIRLLHFLFTLRGKDQMNTQWQLFCLVQNIEKVAKSACRGWGLRDAGQALIRPTSVGSAGLNE